MRADDFLFPERPPDVDGYYRRAFDYEALRAAVLACDGDVVVDGVFLLRPELRDLWDFTILLDAPFELRLERAKARGEEDVERRYRARYQPAWELHVRECDPAAFADVVLQPST